MPSIAMRAREVIRPLAGSNEAKNVAYLEIVPVMVPLAFIGADSQKY
jgi:hypothetical protein